MTIYCPLIMKCFGIFLGSIFLLLCLAAIPVNEAEARPIIYCKFSWDDNPAPEFNVKHGSMAAHERKVRTKEYDRLVMMGEVPARVSVDRGGHCVLNHPENTLIDVRLTKAEYRLDVGGRIPHCADLNATVECSGDEEFTSEVRREPIQQVDKKAPIQQFGDGLDWGGADYVSQLGDVNGDGKADGVLYHRINGDWGCWITGGDKCAWDGHDWGGSNYISLLGDVDGDGKADRVLYHRTSGDWGCWITGGGKCAWDGHDWGGSGYVPHLADVNGDGKADRAVYRASDGNWGIRLTR